jgi:hypothetical protein
MYFGNCIKLLPQRSADAVSRSCLAAVSQFLSNPSMIAGIRFGAGMIKNGIYSLNAVRRDGADGAVGGVLILNEGQLCGGDAFVYYTGSYECSAGKWQGKMTSHEHTPTERPTAARTQHIGFFGNYSDAGAEVDAMALVGQQNIRYDVVLRFLAAISRNPPGAHW